MIGWVMVVWFCMAASPLAQDCEVSVSKVAYESEARCEQVLTAYVQYQAARGLRPVSLQCQETKMEGSPA